MVKRVFFSYFLYNFGIKMASFVQFLANFGTKTYKNCTKNGIFLLYLWIKRINVTLIYNKWYAYLHKLPPLVYIWCIQCDVYNVKYSILYTMLCILYGVSCNFIMCRIRDFALFLVKICRIIQKYPPFCRKDFF